MTRKNRKGHAANIEFILSMFVFFLIAAFPLLNLMGISLSAGILCLLTHQIATRCSQQVSFAGALAIMTQESSSISNSAWARYLNLQATGKGYSGCGCDLSIVSTPIAGGNNTTYPINTPLPSTPTSAQASANVYEYLATTSFQVSPMISMANMPFIGSVPGLGRPVELTWTAARAVEYVDGLSNANTLAGAGAVNAPPLDTLIGSDPTPTWLSPGVNPPRGWRNPGVYNAAPPGMTVVDYDVFIVPANSTSWVSSGITVSAGQKIWIDTHADGLWDGGPTPVSNDASGIKPANFYNPNNPRAIPSWDWRLFGTKNVLPPSWGDLIGFVSNNPPNITTPPANATSAPPPIPLTPPAANNKGFFRLDDNSYQPAPGTGLLQCVENDNLRADNRGAQVVRVLILQ